MDGSKKKLMLVAVIVVSLVLAAVITFVSRSGGSGVPDTFKGQTVWVECRNPDCEAAYQVNKKEYYEYVQKYQNPLSLSAPPMVCKKCGKKSVYKAIKCEKCGLVFFEGAAGSGFSDKCPECGFSKIEQQRKEAYNK